MPALRRSGDGDDSDDDDDSDDGDDSDDVDGGDDVDDSDDVDGNNSDDNAIDDLDNNDSEVMVIFRAKGKYEIFTDMDKNIRQGTYATPTMPLFSGTFA